MIVLFTNNQILDENTIKIDEIIKIRNNNRIIKEIKITKDRFKCTDIILDYTCIEIKENDLLENYLEIEPKINCKNPYDEYKYDKFIIIQYPRDKKMGYSEGKIEKIENNFEIYYSISTDNGSSGSPLIDATRNLNVIGIHCGKSNKFNRGIFIKNILDDINQKYYQNNEINIKSNNIKEFFEIFYNRAKRLEIENSIDLFCNDKKIDFNFDSYLDKFCTLKIQIKQYLTNMIFLFYNCSSLTSLNLSNFNCNNATDMRSLFYNCTSLISLNLSNFNTNNVNNMCYMFYNCSSLISLDLSNFNTNNVKDMRNMFDNCCSLISLNLFNFYTNKVNNMACMLYNCSSLISLNLSNFNTNNVIDMEYMFYNCSSLTYLNLSNFNTNKVTNINGMFTGLNTNCEIIIGNLNNN